MFLANFKPKTTAVAFHGFLAAFLYYFSYMYIVAVAVPVLQLTAYCCFQAKKYVLEPLTASCESCHLTNLYVSEGKSGKVCLSDF